MELSAQPRRETKLIKVYGDLVTKLNEISNRVGIPFMEYVNSALEQAVRAGRLGKTLKEIVDSYERMLIQREAGLVLVPLEAFNRIVEKFYPGEGQFIESVWRESGTWYGKYLLVKVKNSDPLDVFRDMLKDSGWGFREVSLERRGGEGLLKCFSLTLSLENTKLLMNFIEGVIEALGYEIVGRSYLRGAIEIEFKSREKR